MAAANGFSAISPHIFSWQAYEPSVKCELSSSAIATPAGLVFVDPIPLADRWLRELLASGTPCAIVITNGNHARAAAEFRERLAVKVFASEEAADSGFTPDEFIAEGDFTPGGMRVVGLPGAGPGEIALVGDGVICIGDAVIHLEPEGFGLLPAKYCSDAHQLRDSLRKLLSYQFDVMTFAHGVPLVGQARHHLALLLE